jgi:hypothetical protein
MERDTVRPPHLRFYQGAVDWKIKVTKILHRGNLVLISLLWFAEIQC